MRWLRTSALVTSVTSSFLFSAFTDAAAADAPRIATLSIPGDPRFAGIARDVITVQSGEAPDFAAGAGLVDDGDHVPSFAPRRLAALTARIRADLAALRALPWRGWNVDRQIDVRWIAANAERIDRELTVERLYRHRPGAWLETLANAYIAILSYAPDRRDALNAMTAGVPAMVREMASICRPTRSDATVGIGIADGIVGMLKANPVTGRDAAVASLTRYEAQLRMVGPSRPAYAIVGADDYAWRLRHASLLPWTPAALRTIALLELDRVDAQIAALKPIAPPPQPLSPALVSVARHLDQASLLRLYDEIERNNRREIERIGFVTIPAGVGPIHARVTPAAMIPLTGDGGSMDPPPPFVASNVGWWNVEHFQPSATLAARERTVRYAVLYRENEMGTYAVHEGVPGHHLQLSIARLNPDPIRNLFGDPAQVEGWALYAEQEMWDEGGLGRSVRGHIAQLESWRFRIRRVVYDVNVETGFWTLQEGADYKDFAAPGKGLIDPEIQRTINWPAQLIGYFSGKEQILTLKAAMKRKLGRAYSERRFNDDLLALGSVPYVFARAKLLGEPVPGF